MEVYYLCLFFILGTIMGSFYHVVATRLSNEESIVKPGSHCPRCNHFLKWYENIPIISYLFLGGRCSKCNSKIPLSYLIVEIITGALFAVCYHSFGLTLEFVVGLVFISSLITIIISDIEYMIILDEVLVVATLLIAVIYMVGLGLLESAYYIYSGIGAFLVMYSIKIFGDKAFKKESLGGGDIKLMFLFGMVLGLPMAICSIFLATFIAFPISLIVLFSNKENVIPFGPFLSMSAILIFIAKIDIMDVLNFLVR